MVNSYPWQVSLVDPAWQHPKKPFCGGSIISDRHILTAAHCTARSSISTLRVLLGEHDTTDSVADIRTISAITDHPNYDSNKTVNDISILTLNSPITFSSIMSPVCLPEGMYMYIYVYRNNFLSEFDIQSTGNSERFAGDLATAIGWGFTFPGRDGSATLQEVDITVAKNDECRNIWSHWPWPIME